MAKLSPVFNDQTVDVNGDPAVGYQLFPFVANSSTPQTVYTDAAGTIPHTIPIIIDSLGYPTQGAIWLREGTATKFVLALPTDTNPPTSPIKTIDNVTGVGDNTVSVSQWVSSGVEPTYINATTFTLPGDQTTAFQPGRREQFTVSAGTVYGNILTSVFTTLTTVTMQMDAGQALDAGLSVVNHSLLLASPSAEPSIKTQSFQMGSTYGNYSIIGAKGVSVAADTTTSIYAATDGNLVDVSGSGYTIASLGTSPSAGYVMEGTFLGAGTLTNSTNLSVFSGYGPVQINANDKYRAIPNTTAQHDLMIYRKNGAAPSGPSYVGYRDITTATVFTTADLGSEMGISHAGAVTHTMPTASAALVGNIITMTNYGAGLATFNRAGTNLFYGGNLNGATSFVLNQGETATWMVAISGNWILVHANVSFFAAKATAVAATSGTSIDYTLPAGATEFTIALSAVSLSVTANFLLQLATGGSIVTTTYTSSSAGYGAAGATTVSSTSGFIVYAASAAGLFSGHVTFRRVTGNVWTSIHVGKRDTALTIGGAGDISLAGEADRVRITTTNGIDTFDGGILNLVGVR